MYSFEGKTVIITGSSSGIGAATAIEFARHGANITITGRNEDRLTETERHCIDEGVTKGKICKVSCDLKQQSNLITIVHKTLEAFGRIDILVNNAGILTRVSLEDMEMDVFDEIFAVNVRAMVVLTKLCIPYLKSTKGNIINISSSFGKLPSVMAGAYCMSKAAVDMFTKSLAIELGRDGVRVNCVSPGGVHTNLTAGASDKEYTDVFDKCHPLGRQAASDEISKFICFVASDAASFITGSMNEVDGGLTATSAISPYEMNKIEETKKRVSTEEIA